jgi:hypothetical protein
MPHTGIGYFFKNVVIALGLILVWRGTWILLDVIDRWLFGGSHIFTAILGIVVGVSLVYFPERNLKTFERL